MATYSPPTKSPDIIDLGTKNVAGMKLLTPQIHITLITTAICESNLATFIKQDNDHNAAVSAKVMATGAYQDAMSAVYRWLLGVSNTLATPFGTNWNSQWVQAGFTKSTAIPTSIADRLTLNLALDAFFTANPSYEVPSMNQTAAYGAGLHAAALAAQDASTKANVKLKNVSNDWQAAYDTIRAGMTSLVRNLAELLKDDDTRWLSFGFQMPSTRSTPGQPVNVTATQDGNGSIVLQCDVVPLANRYRGRMLIVGVETKYSLAASGTEPLMTITGVEPGRTVQLIIQAVNGSLQGVASDAITYTVLIPATAKPAVAASPVAAAAVLPTIEEEIVAAARNGNGHANGNGHHVARV